MCKQEDINPHQQDTYSRAASKNIRTSTNSTIQLSGLLLVAHKQGKTPGRQKDFIILNLIISQIQARTLQIWSFCQRTVNYSMGKHVTAQNLLFISWERPSSTQQLGKKLFKCRRKQLVLSNKKKKKKSKKYCTCFIILIELSRQIRSNYKQHVHVIGILGRPSSSKSK